MTGSLELRVHSSSRSQSYSSPSARYASVRLASCMQCSSVLSLTHIACCATAVEVVQPSLPYPWLTTPICVVIALNLIGHYYYVCTISPGFVDDPPRIAGSGILWAKKRRAAKHRALTGVRWSDDMHVTRAETTRCKRCGEMRPEVRLISLNFGEGGEEEGAEVRL